MTKLESVEKKLKKISSKDLDSVNEFIEKILSSNKDPEKRKMRLHLGGTLKELNKNYTSIELQHKANEWRVEDTFNYRKK